MRKKYDSEYKAEAVKLVLKHGVSKSQVCQDLGLGKSTLEKWVSEFKRNSAGVSVTAVTESEKEELKRLRKENNVLRMERDILKKATAFFAKGS